MKRIPLHVLLQEFPPIVCRLMARDLRAMGNRQRPLTDKEIARRSGLTEPEVVFISAQHTWEEISVGKMMAFTRGCGIDFDNPRVIDQHRRYLTRRLPSWSYLRRDKEWDSRWRPMIQRHSDYLRSKAT
jgi:hypothetical protein